MNTQPTPISDRIVSQFRKGEATSDGLILTMVELERERDELKRWTSVNGVIDLQRERDEARAESIRWQSIAEGRGRTDEYDTGKAISNLIRQRDEAREILATVTAQRDRMAEAINAATILIAAKGRHNTMLAYEGLRATLQSLTPNDKDLARRALDSE